MNTKYLWKKCCLPFSLLMVTGEILKLEKAPSLCSGVNSLKKTKTILVGLCNCYFKYYEFHNNNNHSSILKGLNLAKYLNYYFQYQHLKLNISQNQFWDDIEKSAMNFATKLHLPKEELMYNMANASERLNTRLKALLTAVLRSTTLQHQPLCLLPSSLVSQHHYYFRSGLWPLAFGR